MKIRQGINDGIEEFYNAGGGQRVIKFYYCFTHYNKKACKVLMLITLEAYEYSPAVSELRIIFRIKWPVVVKIRGRKGLDLKIDRKKLLENYPFFKGANFLIPSDNVNQVSKKRKKTKAELAEIYLKVLQSGRVKNKAELARMLGVSRAWVTIVLS